MNQRELELLRLAEERIAEIYKDSDCEDLMLRRVDPNHSKYTREWVLTLNPNAGLELQVAALGHDIDRAIEARRVKKDDNMDYDQFKMLHAKESARIMFEELEALGFSSSQLNRIKYLIENHEIGGDDEANTLRDADSLSFFNDNIYEYYADRGEDMTRKKVKFMYARMNDYGKEKIRSMQYRMKIIQDIVVEVAAAD